MKENFQCMLRMLFNSIAVLTLDLLHAAVIVEIV